MTVRTKLVRQRSEAARAGAEELLRRIPATDILARLSLESQINDLNDELEPEGAEDTHASIALFFGGKPVVGEVGIDSDFAGAALTGFQDLVTKVYTDMRGELGRRGPLALRQEAALAVTGIVRGSFGFILEEVDPQVQLMDTSLKEAVETTTRLLDAFYSADEAAVQQALERFEQRVVSSVSNFFSLLAANEAVVRLQSDTMERDFRSAGILIAEQLARTSAVEESEETVEGVLLAVLPEGHIFEFREVGSDEAYRGRVLSTVATPTLVRLNAELTNVPIQAVFASKRVLRNGQVARTIRTMLRLYDANGVDQLGQRFGN